MVRLVSDNESDKASQGVPFRLLRLCLAYFIKVRKKPIYFMLFSVDEMFPSSNFDRLLPLDNVVAPDGLGALTQRQQRGPACILYKWHREPLGTVGTVN